MKHFYKLILKNKYKLNIYYFDKDLIFILDDLENAELKYINYIFHLKIFVKKTIFKNTKKLINMINTCIESNNYSIENKKIAF